MSINVNIRLAEGDLRPFIKGLLDVQALIRERDPGQIIAAAQQHLAGYQGSHVPPFIATGWVRSSP